MPTYQYACTACEHRFEAVQSFSDASLTECPECSGKLRKLFGAVGVVFKGSGFYRTDSRSGSSNGSSSGTPAATPAASSSDTKSSDKKSEKKSSSSDSKSSTSAPAAAAS